MVQKVQHTAHCTIQVRTSFVQSNHIRIGPYATRLFYTRVGSLLVVAVIVLFLSISLSSKLLFI